MRFWWVNHKQTFQQEFAGKYIWCPKRKINGSSNHFYETAREVAPGDVIFSFAFGAVQGFGFAKSASYSCPQPDEFGKVGVAWDKRGWRVDVNFRPFPKPLSTSAHAHLIAPLLPQAYSPIRANGHGNQAAYLAEIPEQLALLIAGLIDPPITQLLRGRVMDSLEDTADFAPFPLVEWEDRQQKIIEHQSDLAETTRRALVLARRGQGLFRTRVARHETYCRVTKVDNPSHLIASHIKPWRESNDEERLNAANGLLLTPSIDHLFDRGFISFADDGDVIVSPIAESLSIQRLGVNPSEPPNVGRFNVDQRHFLDYHRKEIFLKSAA